MNNFAIISRDTYPRWFAGRSAFGSRPLRWVEHPQLARVLDTDDVYIYKLLDTIGAGEAGLQAITYPKAADMQRMRTAQLIEYEAAMLNHRYVNDGLRAGVWMDGERGRVLLSWYTHPVATWNIDTGEMDKIRLPGDGEAVPTLKLALIKAQAILTERHTERQKKLADGVPADIL